MLGAWLFFLYEKYVTWFTGGMPRPDPCWQAVVNCSDAVFQIHLMLCLTLMLCHEDVRLIVNIL